MEEADFYPSHFKYPQRLLGEQPLVNKKDVKAIQSNFWLLILIIKYKGNKRKVAFFDYIVAALKKPNLFLQTQSLTQAYSSTHYLLFHSQQQLLSCCCQWLGQCCQNWTAAVEKMMLPFWSQMLANLILCLLLPKL